jgi:uncharacterized BrkB/YihY/UPF0761 family membrane protein
MKLTAAQRSAAMHDEFAQHRDPAAKMGSLVVTGSSIGGVLSIGMFVIVWSALPVVRPFLIAAIGLGVIFAAVLWLGRR